MKEVLELDVGKHVFYCFTCEAVYFWPARGSSLD